MRRMEIRLNRAAAKVSSLSSSKMINTNISHLKKYCPHSNIEDAICFYSSLGHLKNKEKQLKNRGKRSRGNIVFGFC